MRVGSLLIVIRDEFRPLLRARADKENRSLREEAAYLVEWALTELERRERTEITAAA